MPRKAKNTTEDVQVQPTASVEKLFMNENDSYVVLKKPYISEKASMAQSLDKYTFEVPISASRVDVKRNIEKLYSVKVISANSIRLPAKTKQFTRKRYVRPLLKKVIVTLRSGDKIDIIPQ